MNWVWAAAAGLVVGGSAGWVLRRGNHRRDDERHEGERHEGERHRLPPPLSAVAAAAVGLALGWGLLSAFLADQPVIWLASLFFAGIGLVVIWIDIDVHRIPNALTLTSAGVIMVGFAAAAALHGDWGQWGRSLLAGAALLVAFLGLSMVSSVGGGDIKFSASVGLLLGWVGWSAVLAGIMIALLIAATAAIVLLARGRSRRTHLAFGPPLVLGSILALLLYS